MMLSERVQPFLWCCGAGLSDWSFAQELVNSGLADPNLMTYIATLSDGNIYEYSMDDVDTDEIGQQLKSENCQNNIQ